MPRKDYALRATDLKKYFICGFVLVRRAGLAFDFEPTIYAADTTSGSKKKQWQRKNKAPRLGICANKLIRPRIRKHKPRHGPASAANALRASANKYCTRQLHVGAQSANRENTSVPDSNVPVSPPAPDRTNGSTPNNALPCKGVRATLPTHMPPRPHISPDHTEKSVAYNCQDGAADIPVPDSPKAAPGPTTAASLNSSRHAAAELTESPAKRAQIDAEISAPVAAKLVVISLFDGVGSILKIITERLRTTPCVYVAAENDPVLRHLVAEKYNFRHNNEWTTLASGTTALYLDDVKKLFARNWQVLSEIVSLAGQNCKVLVVAGSPCQDLSYAGFAHGLLGLTGSRSGLFYYVHLLIWLLQETYPAADVRFIVENAG